MNNRGTIVADIFRLIEFFAPLCSETETLSWLRTAVKDKSKWQAAHAVFNQIRSKTLKAEKSGAQTLQVQYLFEEACAKTLYNLSGGPAAFDSDSPYWVVPNAISFGRRLGLPDSDVLRCVSVGASSQNDA